MGNTVVLENREEMGTALRTKFTGRLLEVDATAKQRLNMADWKQAPVWIAQK